MIFEKTLRTRAAAAAIAAAAGVAVVAAAFALYALVVPSIGAAGAAALVAGCAALLVLLAGLIAAAKARGHATQQQAFAADTGDMHGVIAKVMEIVKQRPLMATGAALAAGVFAMRNPALLAILVKTLLDPRPPPKR